MFGKVAADTVDRLVGFDIARLVMNLVLLQYNYLVLLVPICIWRHFLVA